MIIYKSHVPLFLNGFFLDVISGDVCAKASLENVNTWNGHVWRSLPPAERHDIAIWLTRLNIGGPSGYAPVGTGNFLSKGRN